ncbi:hypothetical protein DFJ74DRAFT_706905 [Hyaloraphidium curvatum]|nr:hypothetical protein DFJ74DRAFT_706905 [Hyaloraphidium curvatum]
MPIEMLENIVSRIPMILLPSIVALASSCRALREAVGAIAPWKSLLEDLWDEAEEEESEDDEDSEGAIKAPRKRRVPRDRVDPRDLVPKRGKQTVDWLWVLGKYANRLCLGCFALFDKAKDVYPVGGIPIALLEHAFLDLPAEEVPDLSGDDYWDLPAGCSALCAECRVHLWTTTTKNVARPREIAECAEDLDAAAGCEINATEARRLYRLHGEDDLLGLGMREEVVFERRRFTVFEHIYKKGAVLLRAWNVHGGPWGLRAVRKHTKTPKKRRSRWPKREVYEAVVPWKGSSSKEKRAYFKFD